jgi:hypothetical protein
MRRNEHATREQADGFDVYALERILPRQYVTNDESSSSGCRADGTSDRKARPLTAKNQHPHDDKYSNPDDLVCNPRHPNSFPLLIEKVLFPFVLLSPNPNLTGSTQRPFQEKSAEFFYMEGAAKSPLPAQHRAFSMSLARALTSLDSQQSRAFYLRRSSFRMGRRCQQVAHQRNREAVATVIREARHERDLCMQCDAAARQRHLSGSLLELQQIERLRDIFRARDKNKKVAVKLAEQRFKAASPR